MGSGVAGGRIGLAMGRALEQRYGKALTNVGVGIGSILIGLCLAILYFAFQPVVTDADLSPVEVALSRFQVRDSSLDLWSGDTLYSARARFWRPKVPDSVLRDALASHSTITLWLRPGSTRVFGLRAGSLIIPTRAGINEYMNNRAWFLGLWVAAVIAGIGAVIYGLWLQRRGPQQPHDYRLDMPDSGVTARVSGRKSAAAPDARVRRSASEHHMPEWDDPALEEQWCHERRAEVTTYLESEGLEHGRVGDWPAWHVAPYVSVWAIESKKRPDLVGWWVICGDLPTDYVSAAQVKHPREAIRFIAEEWREQARLMASGERPADIRIGRPKDWASLGPLLDTGASMLLEWANDGSVWESVDAR